MDTNIKISLSIILPGSVMFSKEASFKNANIIPARHDKEFLKVKDERGHFETITVNTRKCIPAKQVINMTEQAYNYFISEEKPRSYKGDWRKMSEEAKLNWHMNNIAKSLGGELDDYKVLD